MTVDAALFSVIFLAKREWERYRHAVEFPGDFAANSKVLSGGIVHIKSLNYYLGAENPDFGREEALPAAEIQLSKERER